VTISATLSFDVSLEEYHSSKYISSSKLKDFSSRGPRFFAAKHVTGKAKSDPDTDAKVFGQIFEDAVNGVPVDMSRYVLKPEGMEFRSKENKKWRDDHLAAGCFIVEPDDLERMHSMQESLRGNETALDLLRGAKAQGTLRMSYPGVPGLQSRPDWINLIGPLTSGYTQATIDLKTCISINGMSSGRDVQKWSYHVQAAIVRELVRAVTGNDVRCYLLAVEKSLPFRCQVVEVTPEWLDAGWRWCERQLGKLAGHFERNEWPRVERELVALPPPPPWIENDNVSEDEESAA
jgi:hypothetical protein